MREIEVWKPIKGYEGRYEASNLGNIRSLDRMIKSKGEGKRFLRGRVLKKLIVRNGYEHVALCKDGRTKRVSVHRVIASTFLKRRPEDEVVNHINGIKTDNRVSNLEWCTYKQNIRHAIDTGLIVFDGRHVVRSDGVEFRSVTEAARAIKAPHANVEAQLQGKRSHVHGYTFRYVDRGGNHEH